MTPPTLSPRRHAAAFALLLAAASALTLALAPARQPSAAACAQVLEDVRDPAFAECLVASYSELGRH